LRSILARVKTPTAGGEDVSNNQNESNGGCLLFFIDFIFNIIRNRKIRKYNKHARGLEQYQKITTDALFPSDSYQENIIVSGGDVVERATFSERILRNAVIRNRAVIILHISNWNLEKMIASNGFGMISNKNSKTFDPFTSFELQEICQVVLDTCKEKYDIKPTGRYILQVVYDLLSAKKMRPYFANYADFTYHQMASRINDSLTAGEITQSQATDLNSLLMMGQSEISKIDTFFSDMKSQIGHIAATNPAGVSAQSVLYAIKSGKTLCIDLNSSANVMLIEMIVNSLTIAMSRGYEFSLYLDDVAIANNEMLKNVLCQKSNHNNIIFSKDLYALLNGKEDLFSTIVGETEKTVLLSHGSHLSCEKWAKYIGEYEKIDVSHNTSGGFFAAGQWGYSSNLGQTMTNKREYKVNPEEINRLPHGQVFVYDNRNGSLIQANVI